MTLRVVGMGGVRHVGGGQQRHGQPAQEVLRPPPAPARSVRARYPAGRIARRGRTSSRPPRGRRAPAPAGSRAARRPATPPTPRSSWPGCPAGERSAGCVGADHRRRGQVVRHEVGGQHVGGGHPGPLGDIVDERTPRPPHPQTALTCRCGSNVTDLRSSARWMASCGTRRIGSSIRTSRRVIPVPSRTDSRPLIPRSRSSQELSHTPPVRLQRHHPPARDEPVRMLLDPQVGAVGVRADDPEWSAGALAIPGDQRAGPNGEVASRLVGPAIGFAQFGVPGIDKPGGDRGANMKRRRGSVDEFAEASRRRPTCPTSWLSPFLARFRSVGHARVAECLRFSRNPFSRR